MAKYGCLYIIAWGVFLNQPTNSLPVCRLALVLAQRSSESWIKSLKREQGLMHFIHVAYERASMACHVHRTRRRAQPRGGPHGAGEAAPLVGWLGGSDAQLRLRDTISVDPLRPNTEELCTCDLVNS
jgi:hypothetical protein